MCHDFINFQQRVRAIERKKEEKERLKAIEEREREIEEERIAYTKMMEERRRKVSVEDRISH